MVNVFRIVLDIAVYYFNFIKKYSRLLYQIISNLWKLVLRLSDRLILALDSDIILPCVFLQNFFYFFSSNTNKYFDNSNITATKNF